jgi:hypothetical protein
MPDSGVQEMERAASKGEIDEAELRALEEDMTGRVCHTIWHLFCLPFISFDAR